MKYKVAYKGDGTKEVGKKIIDELERLGGVNYHCKSGISSNYYYIDKTDNRIYYSINLPKTYTLIQPESIQKLFRLL